MAYWTTSDEIENMTDCPIDALHVEFNQCEDEIVCVRLYVCDEVQLSIGMKYIESWLLPEDFDTYEWQRGDVQWGDLEPLKAALAELQSTTHTQLWTISDRYLDVSAELVGDDYHITKSSVLELREWIKWEEQKEVGDDRHG